ncbi:hypothetical protein BDZ91DRAFT_315287 [Kalaharituber pfeilii]|nr:hypothetical protein BDZ91DRAFT_315287 [Kalaharituber pfeilii]
MSISMSVSTPSSTITIHLPHLTQLAPWPIPYAPLTTHFTPPSGCETWTLITNKPTVTGTAIGQYINLLDTNDKTCFPPGYGKDVWSATFSPGIYCPSGYVTAATGTEVGSAVWESGIPHSSDVTTVACCLSIVEDSRTTIIAENRRMTNVPLFTITRR